LHAIAKRCIIATVVHEKGDNSILSGGSHTLSLLSLVPYVIGSLAAVEPDKMRWYLIIAGLVVGAIAVVLELIRGRIAQRKKGEELWRDFEEVAIERGLSADELNLCREMAQENVPDKPLRLLTSKEVFDTCAGKRMSALRATGATAEELEAASDMLGDIRKRLGLTFVPFGRRLHSTRGLQPDQKLTIELEKGPSGMRFLATVLDVTDLGIIISPPEGSAGQVTLEPGQNVAVAFWRGDDARYMFKTQVHKSLVSPKLAIVLAHADRLERTQARTFYRVRLSVPTTIAPLALRDPAELERVSDISSLPSRGRFEGSITSLSGGGMSIVSRARVNVDDLLLVEIDLLRAYAQMEVAAPDDARETTAIDAVCKVVGVSALPGPRYLTRASFALINEMDRDRIVRFVNVKEQKIATEDLERPGRTGEQ
jgi:c-di-GMP-binding flagellar brake protein YcgR